MTPHVVPSPRALGTLAALSGVLAGGQALLWSRVIGSANGNRPESFAHALGAVIAGFAIGLLAGRSLQERIGMGALRLGALVVAVAGGIFYLAMPAGAAIMRADAAWGRAFLLVAAGLASLAIGAMLPALAAELARATSRPEDAPPLVLGAHLLGAALGAPLTGYLLLDLESIEHAIIIVALAALGLAQGIWLVAPERRRRAGVTVFSLAALAALVTHSQFFAGFLEAVHFGPEARQRAYVTVVQGRSGVVGVTADGQAYADGLYNGAYAIDPDANINLISRAYFVPALHRAPRRILQLGLGTGAWSRVLADVRGVDSVTIVEANPGTVDALWRHPELARVLDDPRVRLHLADPRRWLLQHPERRFDVIVVNGPGHWRAGATHLLSEQFLQLLKSRLSTGGMAYIGATGSLDALYTASGVWRYVVRVSNSVAASDAPFDQTREERRAALLAVTGPDGAPRIRGEHAARTLDAMLNQASGELAPALRRANDLWNITDDNMASEFKATGAGAWWRALPARLWRPDRAWPTVLF